MSQNETVTDNGTVRRRRKKASRACSHCQKAHLTCDDSRPCQRCIKRGLQTTCADGVRKKAKYLQDDESGKGGFCDVYNLHYLIKLCIDSTSNIMTPPPPPMLSFLDNNNNNNNNYGFESNTNNLEYGILSSMIPNVVNNTTTDYNNTMSNNTPNNNDFNTNWLLQHHLPQNFLDSDTMIMNGGSASTSPSISTMNGPSTPHFSNSKPVVIRRRKGIGNTPEEIYARVQKPYNYVDSYHYLLQYVKHRMGREELIRISRALVLFRPSYMSVVASLTEEDLIYMEKCVQRTLLEFEKLISFSGTPTVVWRRTGEIVLVSKEFLLLTQWSKEALLGQKKYIYELMDNGSAIEYWEKFSQHAFDNAESGVYMSVILMSPSFRPVPCSFCFTLKRDIFDLPCVVVGNFLPILGANAG
ncbi:unnamed protein product [Mucor hiemalis]